jgi:acetyl esterase/lipase
MTHATLHAVRLTALAWAMFACVAGAAEPDFRLLKDIDYARIGEVTLKLNLHLPAGSTRAPIIVWIHGGGWEKGAKEHNPFTGLVKHGFAVASVQYRLTDVAAFPAQIHDCKGAIRWLRGNASKYGYSADRIGAAGISAGGHLTALLATTADVKELEGQTAGWYDQSSRIQAALDICGPSDFILAARDAAGYLDKPMSPVFKLFGGTIGDKYALAKLASPVTHITPDDAPLLIFHGDKDPLVNLNQSRTLMERYQRLDLDSSLVVIPGGGHVAREFFDTARTAMVVAFFNKHLRADPAAN